MTLYETSRSLSNNAENKEALLIAQPKIWSLIERYDAGIEKSVCKVERSLQAILCHFERRNRLRHGRAIGNGAVDER